MSRPSRAGEWELKKRESRWKDICIFMDRFPVFSQCKLPNTMKGAYVFPWIVALQFLIFGSHYPLPCSKNITNEVLDVLTHCSLQAHLDEMSYGHLSNWPTLSRDRD
jgi:hypothetical protein